MRLGRPRLPTILDLPYTVGVTALAKKLLDEALTLPSDERRRIGEVLLASVSEESEHEIDPAWRDEIVRRIHEVQSGAVTPEPWSEVSRQIRAALGRE